MNNEVKSFNFEANELRTVLINQEVWFVGKDVAKTLGYSRTADAIKSHVDEEDKGVGKIQTPGGMQQMTIINQSGVISLALSSKLSSARKFKRWVTSDVIPTVLKTGSYSINQDSYLIEDPIKRAEKWIIEAKERQELKSDNLLLNQQINEFKPKIDFVDVVLKSKSLVSTSIISKDYGMSATEMNKLLHELGVQYRQGKTWLLYAPHQRKGWTQTETFSFKHKDGTSDTKPSTKWTQKGRLGLYELLKSHNILPTIERED